jgi:hypothetical protein
MRRYASLHDDARKAIDLEITSAVKHAEGVEKRGVTVDRNA